MKDPIIANELHADKHYLLRLDTIYSDSVRTNFVWIDLTTSTIKGLSVQKNKKANDQFLISLGDSIRERRIELLLSQEQLGILAKLHRSYITEVENGMRNISVTTLLRISRALKSDPSFHLSAAEDAIKNSNKSIL